MWADLMMIRDLNGPMVETNEHPSLGALLVRKVRVMSTNASADNAPKWPF